MWCCVRLKWSKVVLRAHPNLLLSLRRALLRIKLTPALLRIKSTVNPLINCMDTKGLTDLYTLRGMCSINEVADTFLTDHLIPTGPLALLKTCSGYTSSHHSLMQQTLTFKCYTSKTLDFTALVAILSVVETHACNVASVYKLRSMPNPFLFRSFYLFILFFLSLNGSDILSPQHQFNYLCKTVGAEKRAGLQELHAEWAGLESWPQVERNRNL